MKMDIKHNNLKFCPECKRNFSRITHLRRHVKKFHPDKLSEIAPKLRENNFQCQICLKSFSNKKYFQNHKKNHEVSVLVNKKKLSCPICKFCGTQSKELIEHFNQIHNDINVITSNHTFSSFSSFETWKLKIESDRKEQYVKQRGDVSTSKGNIIKYHCHRSGYFITKSKGLRHVKIQGSKKINSYCPASMKVMISNEKCHVVFIETHIGHQNELGYMNLTSQERETIAAKIAAKIPLIEIINEVRDSVANSNSLERVHLLTKKDLYNIEQCFNLKSSSIRHKNDALSVEAWVNQMETNGCILFYKPQDIVSEDHRELKKEDFVLIIMNSAQEEFLRKYGADCICADGTHGLNQYDFELNTLLVLDDLREGFPCAFLISNRNDETVMNIFYNYIKGRVGIISAKTFMSDMAPSSYNAWEKIMGPPENRLYCTWHVDRALRKNLTKINSKEKQVAVYKFLRTMLQETDAEAFKSMLSTFLEDSRNDPDTADFAVYFAEHYANVTERWAYCYRLGCGINTNMHLERMHRTVKHIYLHGQKVKRLDKGINAIMQFLRDKLFERLITISKGKLCTKIRVLRERHETSEKLELGTVLEYENNSWQVASSSGYDIYNIHENLKTCECKIICTHCNVCIHRYLCTCVDSAIKWNMCKHVHLVCRYLKQKNSNSLQIEADEENDGHCVDSVDMESNILQNELRIGQNRKLLSIQEEITIMRNKFNEYLNGISTEDEVEAIKKLMAPMGPTLAALKSRKIDAAISIPPKNKSIPHNKKIEPQRRLYSVKRKRGTKVAVKMPTYQESLRIALDTSNNVQLNNN